jgi:hypothetical protein
MDPLLRDSGGNRHDRVFLLESLPVEAGAIDRTQARRAIVSVTKCF